MTNSERQEFLSARKQAGLKIGPATAEVDWEFVDMADPYGIRPDLRAECVGRVYFACSPGDDIWVHSEDLPKATWDALRERLDREPVIDNLNFPF